MQTCWPEVAIIVLNWNGWRDTIKCLESVYQLDYPDYLTIVVDNGSWDESVKRIKAWAKENLGEGHVFVEYTRSTALQGGEEEREDALEVASPHKAEIKLRPDMPTGPLNRVADHPLTKKLLGWEPQVPFIEGCIGRLIGTFRRRNAKRCGPF